MSIVSSTYNTGTYLEQNIWSIRNQTYQNWEFILVDDGSSDLLTIEILDKYPKIDPRIKVFKLNSNYGLPTFARNVGISKA